jgi:hypothetical protein
VAMGAASMCWDPLPTGTFDSTRAGGLAAGLYEAIVNLPAEGNAELVQRLCEQVEHYDNGEYGLLSHPISYYLHKECIEALRALAAKARPKLAEPELAAIEQMKAHIMTDQPVGLTQAKAWIIELLDIIDMLLSRELRP